MRARKSSASRRRREKEEHTQIEPGVADARFGHGEVKSRADERAMEQVLIGGPRLVRARVVWMWSDGRKTEPLDAARASLKK